MGRVTVWRAVKKQEGLAAFLFFYVVTASYVSS